MKQEVFKISIKKDITCNKSYQAAAAIFDAAPNNWSTKVVIGAGKKGGKWPVHIESETSPMFGKIKEIVDESGKAISDGEVEPLRRANYSIVLTKKTEDGFEGTLTVFEKESIIETADYAEVVKKADELVAKELVTREVMNQVLEILQINEVNTNLMLRVLNRYRKYKRPVKQPSTVYVDPYLDDAVSAGKEGMIAEGLRAAVSGHAMICEGEKSVGKNVYLETIAFLMQMPLYLITFTRQMSPASIYGEKTTDNTAAEKLAGFDAALLAEADRIDEKIRFAMQMMARSGGAWSVETVNALLSEHEQEVLKKKAEFEKLKAQSSSVNIVIDASELYDWLEDGGLMVFNEANMADANFYASFTNQLLDGTGFLFIPGRGIVPIHPDCVLFTTQNAEYTGTEVQNEATMSRFGCLNFHQPKTILPQLRAAVEAALKKHGFEGAAVDRKVYNQAESFYIQCRSAVEKSQVSNACLNIRGFVRAIVEVAESGGATKLRRQIENQVINTAPVDERASLVSILNSLVDC